MSNYRSLLSRATEGTDAPTPGYLYVDLAKACSSNPNVCQDCASFLVKRLASKQNPNIKYKCCKVIAKLCDSVPRNGFRRCIAQDHEGITAIKEALNYRGQPDPVRGDTPNQKVREAAKEALDSVYSEAPSSETVVAASGYGSNSSSMSPHYGTPPHASGSRMQGIGNPMYADPRNDPRYNGEQPVGFQAVVSEAKEVIVGMIKDPLARNIGVPEPPRHSGSYGGPTYGRPPPGSSELSRRTGGEWTMASNRGPGAQDYSRDTSSSSYNRPGTVGGSWGHAGSNTTTPSVTINHHPPTTTSSTGTAVSDGTYEKNLILELCPPGGMKPVPPPDKLANFARTCASLNSDLVCPVLLDLIEDGQPWIIRAKALWVMKTAIENGTRLSDHTNPYRNFFYACAEEIQPLGSHSRSAICEPARHVLELLGVESTTAAAPAAPAPAPNLLDFGDDEAAPPQAAPAAAPSSSSSMFGGMQVKQKGTAAAPPVSAPPVAAPPVAAPPVASPPVAAPNLLDFDATNGTAAAPVVDSAASMFGEMTVKESEAAPAGSSFGFINNDAPVAEHTAPPSFDPLKANGSPNSAQKKPMVMSPEQIQAMAYQQMMMQQQYQQMQMALMQQQMGGGGVVVPVFPNMGPVRRTPSGNGPNFSFQAKPAKKDDKKFDFVMDAMKTAGHKK